MDQVGSDSLSLILSFGMIGMFILALSIILFVVVYKRRIVEEQLEHQQDLVETAIAIQEEERKRFAADLHDEIGGGISTILLSVSSLEYELDSPQSTSARIKNIQTQLNNLLNNVREISYNITPYTLETYGLIATLDDVCFQIQESGQIQVEFTYEGEEERLHFSKELAIYRIVKELLSNTIKHANASIIKVSIHYHEHTFELHYTDNGIGYSDDDTITNGNGIKNMIQRAKILDADFQIKSSLGFGTEARLIVKR